MTTHFWRRFAVPLSSALALTGVVFAAAPSSVAQAATVSIDPSSMTSVHDAYLNQFLPALAVTNGWTGSTASCTAGTSNPAARAATITVVNYYRGLAGLLPVTENATATTAAQQAALVMAANNSLSHYIDPTWKCYSAAAADAAMVGNLALGYTTSGLSIVDYMSDDGIPDIGHRTWVLYPPQSQVGVGITDTGYSLGLWNVSGMSTNQRPAGGTAWPSKGYFPYENLPSSRYWSYSRPGVDFTNASVTVTKNGTPLAVSGVLSVSGYGDPTLTWTMPTLTMPPVDSDDTYHVTIAGPVNDSYDVKVFSAATITVGPIIVSGSASVGSTLTATASSVTPSDSSLSYAWYRGTTQVGQGRSYTVALDDSGQTLTVKATGTKYGWNSGTHTSTGVTVPALTAISGRITSLDAGPISGIMIDYDNVTCDSHADITVTTGYDHNGSATSGADGRFTFPAIPDQCYLVSIGSNGLVASINGQDDQAYIKAGSSTVDITIDHVSVSGVTISGGTAIGQQLASTIMSYWPTHSNLTYQWLRDGQEIAGANAATYTIVAGDAGHQLSLRVTAATSGYTTAVTSAPLQIPIAAAAVFTPTIAGSSELGSTLTATANTPPGWSATGYQWLRNGTAIAGATSTAYVTQPGDNTAQISVRVTASRSGYADSQAVSGAITASCRNFSDVPTSQTFYASICWAAATGITKGTGDGSTYSPDNPVNRGSMAAFIYRLAGSPAWTPPPVSPFADVTPDNQFYSAITWLASTNITVGTQIGGRWYYQPNNAVNRGSMAAFMYRLSGKPAWAPPATSPFSDIDQANQFYSSVTWLANEKITVGSLVQGRLNYLPGNAVNRGSMAAFMNRLDKTQLECTPFPQAIGC